MSTHCWSKWQVDRKKLWRRCETRTRHHHHHPPPPPGQFRNIEVFIESRFKYTSVSSLSYEFHRLVVRYDSRFLCAFDILFVERSNMTREGTHRCRESFVWVFSLSSLSCNRWAQIVEKLVQRHIGGTIHREQFNNWNFNFIHHLTSPSVCIDAVLTITIVLASNKLCKNKQTTPHKRF